MVRLLDDKNDVKIKRKGIRKNDNMKVGIITLHNVYNFGAVLQATALLKTIQSKGIDCELINYDSKQMQQDRKMFDFSFSLDSFARNIRTLLSYKRYNRRNNKFNLFMEENYVLSERCETLEELKEKGKTFSYDCIITGSDQTFCLHLRENVESMKPYFLDFANLKKMSYASSFGEKLHLNTKEEECWIAEKLQEYSNLSVRETSSAEYVNKLIGIMPKVVLDPTLLLKKNDWRKFEQETKYEKSEYIFFYTVLSDKWVVEEVEELAKMTGLKVIALHLKNRYELNTKFIRIEDVGPAEFLSLLKNAKYVVTTSFHATAFAINYQKNFSSLIVGKGNRIISLLSLLKLTDRIIRGESDEIYAQYEASIDYEKVEPLLEKERASSLDFLFKGIADHGNANF